LPDPDPDRYHVQANEKNHKLNFFFQKISKFVKNTENYGTFDTDEKDKTLKSGNAVTKSKIFGFSNMCKTWDLHEDRHRFVPNPDPDADLDRH
jgi:hypothetical protein